MINFPLLDVYRRRFPLCAGDDCSMYISSPFVVTYTITTTTNKSWADLSLKERIDRAFRLIGQPVRYALKDDYEKGKAVHADWPVDWREATLVALVPKDGKAALKFSSTVYMLGYPWPVERVILFDDIQLLERAPKNDTSQLAVSSSPDSGAAADIEYIYP